MNLGPRDEKRFRSVPSPERDFLTFEIDFCFKILDRRPSQLEALEVAANALTRLGYYADGLKLDQRLAKLLPENPVVFYNLACSLALTHQIDEAFEALEKAFRLGYEDLVHPRQDPDLANLRSDPRFAQLLARVAAWKRETSAPALPSSG